MAKITLTGVIQTIGQTQSFGTNGFTKRDFVVSEDGTKYPNPVKFTLKKDNCALADNFQEGDKVTVSASINGREWTNPKTQQVQYFIDLDAYKIEDCDGTASKGSGKKSKPVPPPAEPPAEVDDMMDDDQMPF